MTYSITVDTGGTFTDVVVADSTRVLGLFKARTDEHDVVAGIVEALGLAADQLGLTMRGLLAQTSSFVYATTLATNAILQGRTARTAFLTTEGHPDILLYREGGKPHPLDISVRYPDPYVPRSLTFEVRERVLADGTVYRPLDEAHLLQVIDRIRTLDVEAVGVCLLWSVANPIHEQRVGTLLREQLEGVEITLSHRLNPTVREYRRASATVIDASIKPLVRVHLEQLEQQLRDLGFRGSPLMVTHVTGGVQYLSDILEAPIYSVDSGPALAPIAALALAGEVPESDGRDLVVMDCGGTSCDVSLTRAGSVIYTRDKWLGPRFLGHLTGLPAVDTRSVGAGGGSLASVDSAGLLRVGPDSAGAEPGPACYGRGGIHATVTDAAVVLGYLDPDYFLGGRLRLSRSLAVDAVDRDLAKPLSITVEAAAESMMQLHSEMMRSFIVDVTVKLGVDPRESLFVAGGGAAGLNVVPIARLLGIGHIVIPRLAAGLSAIGGQCSDLTAVFTRSVNTTSDNFALDRVTAAVDAIESDLADFELRAAGDKDAIRTFFCEARYVNQLQDLDVPLGSWSGAAGLTDVEGLRGSFDRLHQELFSVSQPGEPVEFTAWRGMTRITRPKPQLRDTDAAQAGPRTGSRPVSFGGLRLDTPVYRPAEMSAGTKIKGPAIIEETTTTIVLPPGSSAIINPSYYLVDVEG
jgi:N-methylhydantoinase A